MVIDTMRLENSVFALLQRAVEIVRHLDIVRYEPDVAKRFIHFGSQIDQYKPNPSGVGRLLDLRKAVRGRRVDPGDQPEIENQKTAIMAGCEQSLDMLVQTVGGTEEQIALQAHALKFPAIRAE